MEPARRPEMTTWPTTASVIRTPTGPPERGARRKPGGRAASLSLAPLRGWIPRLAVREVVGPDDHALAVLPLEHDHLVRDLEAVGLDLVVAERGPGLHLQELLAYLVGVQRSRLPDRVRVEQAARVAGRRVIRGLVLELFLVGGEELLLARIRQRLVPLGGAVDVLRVLLQEVVELGQVAAHREPEHLRVHVELLHLPR